MDAVKKIKLCTLRALWLGPPVSMQRIIYTRTYWVTHNSKFWSILFFAFRFNFNMSQDPDSMQSPEQVSDFDGDAWFWRSRRLKFVSVQCILYEPPYILVF